MSPLPVASLTLRLSGDATKEEKALQEQYWHSVAPAFEALASAVLSERPAKPAAFLLDWLAEESNQQLLHCWPSDLDDGELTMTMRLFTEMDIDGSGTIDRFEMERVMEKAGMLAEDVGALFLLFDKSGDGHICYREFLDWLWNDGAAAAEPAEDVAVSRVSQVLRSKMRGLVSKSKAASVQFVQMMDMLQPGNHLEEEDDDEVLETTHVAPTPSWRAATWNAAAEVTKLEFLPMPAPLAERMEQLAGAVILRLRGVANWSNKSTRWERYAPGAAGIPSEEELASLVGLTPATILAGLDAERLAGRWQRWREQNEGGARRIREHLQAWSDESLEDLFQVAMACRTDDDIPLAQSIPGLAVNYQAILSRPDLWFSKRTYHLRGPRWLEFLQDAGTPSVTAEDFWAKWVDGLPETYKVAPDRPVEFLPTEPEVDYAALAIWDGFLFQVARKAIQLSGAPLDAEALAGRIEVPLERLVARAQEIVDCALGREKVDMLFLQEGGRLVPPSGWSVLPRLGAATAVWVPEALVDWEMTKKAEAALAVMKENFSQCIATCDCIEEKMFRAGTQTMMKISLDELKNLKLSEQLDHTCRHMIVNWLEYLEKELLSKNKSPSKDQMKRFRKWFEDEKVAVAVIVKEGAPMLLVSAHGESSGTTCGAAFMLAHALRGELQADMEKQIRVVVGMDSNVKTENTGAAFNPTSLKAAAESLRFRYPDNKSFVFAGSDEAADHTVMKTRGFLQAQMKGKAGVPDKNFKDYIFYLPTPGPDGKEAKAPALHGRVINGVSSGSGEASYSAGEMPRGLDFPSDHALVVVSAAPSSSAFPSPGMRASKRHTM